MRYFYESLGKYLPALLLAALLSAGCSDDGPGDAETETELPEAPDEEEGEEAPDVEEEDGGEDGTETASCFTDADCSDGNPCNGNERCDPESGLCIPGTAVDDGLICSLSPRELCLGGERVPSLCGDGFVDTGNGEFCEPPGTDGCDDDCLIPCEGDADCLDDGNPCNGSEYCSLDTTRCSRRDPQADGSVCSIDPRGLCLGGLCTRSICGDGFLDAGGGEFCEPPYEEGCGYDCRLPCGDDPDCPDDHDPCNGRETCDADTTRCTRADPAVNGALCSADPRMICLVGTCTKSLCGDGFLDSGGDEFCEPPGSAGCDGDCRLPCDGDADCLDDGNVCNGPEHCDTDTSRCSRGERPASGTVCSLTPRLVCLAGVCTESLCGDGFLDTGGGEFCEPPGEGDCDEDCRWLCDADPDCLDDENPCNGVEYCDTDTQRCTRRDRLADGTECASGPRLVCLGSTCQASRCGDGFIDAGSAPPEQCEDGNLIAGDGCEDDCTYTCELDADCDDLSGCTVDACLITDHLCSHELRPAGTVCRTSMGDCDPEETCDGATPDCPADALFPDTTVCRVPVSQCDAPEYCDGAAAACPTDLLQPPGTACYDFDPCTFSDVCDGAGLCAGTLSHLSSVASVTAGRTHTCIRTLAGGVKCWGDNIYGQMGEDASGPWTRPTPVDVPGLLSGVARIDAGYYETCAVMTGGSVRCWGPTVTDVSGLASSAIWVSSGGSHACAVLDTGAVQCWGDNASGQLGDGTTTSSAAPVTVSGLASSTSAVSAGESHTCALLDTGAVQCWGANASGQLGDGTTTGRLLPTNPPILASAAIAVSAGGSHTCALLDTGAVQCWGSNAFGQLGDGSTTPSPSPVTVAGLASSATFLSAGADHGCVVVNTGTVAVQCWGRNSWGQLGDGTTTDRASPVDVSGLTAAAAVDAGTRHSCAVLASGGLSCWGFNRFGELGIGRSWFQSTPVDGPGLPGGASHISAGYNHVCATLTAGGMRCWGANWIGQLGNGTTVHSFFPVTPTGIVSGVVSSDTGDEHTCALFDDASLQCWGWNNSGALGDGTTSDSSVPVSVLGLSTGAATVSLGRTHSCGLTPEGGLKCWGDNWAGQLGDGTTTDRLAPVDVSGLASNVLEADAGMDHTCAVTASGAARCWGDNGAGRLGDGTTVDSPVPVDVAGLGSGVTSISAGDFHSCAMTDTGAVRCWGENFAGKLGNGTDVYSYTPVDVLLDGAVIESVFAGREQTCMITNLGGLKCWGWNGNGNTGTGSIEEEVWLPRDVVGLTAGVESVAMGYDSMCAQLTSGQVKCWGDNAFGEHGIGDTLVSHLPVDVCSP